jgi:hypothetical protein
LRLQHLLCIALALSAVTFVANDVAANGSELLPGGTQAVARGGAVAARPSDPMVLLQNPAGLTELCGYLILLNIYTTFHDMCVDP